MHRERAHASLREVPCISKGGPLPVKKTHEQLATWDNLFLAGNQIFLRGEKEKGPRGGNSTER